MKSKASIALFVTGLLLTASACAQDWPQKTVRIVVPYAAGSAPDIIARMIFDRVQKNTGKSMVVENKGGASGMIGTAIVATAAPDGHTLVLAPSGPLAMNALLYKKMSYSPAKDLAPVALVAETPTILVVGNNVPVKNGKELVAEMARPGVRMAYASPGIGTLGHLDMAYLVAQSGADVPHIVYSGSPQVITGLISGDIQAAVSSPLTVSSFVTAGRIKAIAAIGTRRSFLFPDLPTLKEQGMDFGPTSWFGVSTTAGTPPSVLEKMHAEIALALKDPEIAKNYRSQGLDVVDMGPAAFTEYIKEDMKLWEPIITKYAISLD